MAIFNLPMWTLQVTTQGVWPNPSVTAYSYITHHSLGVELHRELCTFLQCKLCIYKPFCEVSVSLHMSVITQFWGNSVLIMAVRWGMTEVISLLLKAGVNVHLQDMVYIVNPRRVHAQRGLRYLVCVSVCACVSVSTYSRPTGTKPAREGYQRLQRNKHSKNNVAISLIRRRSGLRNRHRR